jgi:hypothetical protein
MARVEIPGVTADNTAGLLCWQTYNPAAPITTIGLVALK